MSLDDDSSPKLERGSLAIGVIILNYNGLEDTMRCIESVRTSEGVSARIIMIDNASTDGSCEALKKSEQDLNIIQNPRNFGFAGGMNAGLRRAIEEQLQYAVLLNNDVVLEPGLLRELVAFADGTPEAAIVGPRIVRLDSPTDNQFAWQDGVREPLDTIDLSGSAFLARLPALKAVGLFDPVYFMYWEEKDLFERCVRAGFRTVYLPTQARALHKIGASTAKLPGLQEYFMIRNGFIFIRRYKGVRWLLKHLIGSAISVLRPDNTRLRVAARLRGLRDGFKELLREEPAGLPARARQGEQL